VSGTVRGGAEPANSTGLPVAEAARRVGVSASTLRSWERRYGLAPSGRTDGGHRRYTAGDLAALLQLRRFARTGVPVGSAAEYVKRSMPPAPPPHRRVVQSFAEAATELNATAMRSVAERIIARSGVVEAWTTVFVPVLQQLGERWDCEPDGIVREHVVASALLDVLDRRASARARPSLLAAVSPNEQHTLPLHALRAALAERDIPLQILDAAPAASIRAAVRALAPTAVLVWAQVPVTADVRLLRRIAAEVPALYAAGPGWAAKRLPERIDHLEEIRAAVAALSPWVG
jgi:DNA-binding transcriptional MerR regulator